MSAKTQYALILADIAMAAAIACTMLGSASIAAWTMCRGASATMAGGPGDDALQDRVTAMATAAATSCKHERQQLQPPPGNMASRWMGQSQGMADFFEAKRNAVLTYNNRQWLAEGARRAPAKPQPGRAQIGVNPRSL